MGCEDCDDAPLHGAYLRVGDSTVGFGNVEIVACRKHWKWTAEKLIGPEPAPLFTPEEIAVVEAAGYLARGTQPHEDI